ncbi:hypothetical protein QFZ54_003830 [Sphingomonas faeni]|nr:hypothetical protein [Sphingomonas faeni]
MLRFGPAAAAADDGVPSTRGTPHGDSTGRNTRYPAASAHARRHGDALNAVAYPARLCSPRSRLTAFLLRSPETATVEDVRRFQLHQRGHGVGASVIGATVSALRFLFDVTLDRPDLSRKLVLAARPRKLPDVLSVEEMARLLEAAPGIKYRAALGVAYGAGLRVSEVAHKPPPVEPSCAPHSGRRHLPCCRSCVPDRPCRASEPRPAQGHVGCRTLLHRCAWRPHRGLNRLRPTIWLTIVSAPQELQHRRILPAVDLERGTFQQIRMLRDTAQVDAPNRDPVSTCAGTHRSPQPVQVLEYAQKPFSL